jgi:protein-tyrosine phosphatase
MIDIHTHILHGLDDGPAQLGGSLDFARAAVAAGTTTIVATPHIRDDYPFDLDTRDEHMEHLRAALAEHEIPLELVSGGEVSLAKSLDMSTEDLHRVALGGGPYLLVESPYGPATDLLEQTLFNLQARGFRPVLAHPERSPSFQTDVDRLATLVERGMFTSITAASVAGRFGRTVRRATVEMLSAGLVHDIASDAHDTSRRPPDLRPGVESLDAAGLRGNDSADWFTRDVPGAMLAGEPLPPAPQRRRQRRLAGSLFRRG